LPTPLELPGCSSQMSRMMTWIESEVSTINGRPKRTLLTYAPLKKSQLKSRPGVLNKMGHHAIFRIV
jgi:hypothetical protein